jgi:hypothetical protein
MYRRPYSGATLEPYRRGTPSETIMVDEAPTSPTPTNTTSERRTIALATLSVLAIGLLIAGAMLWVLNRGDATADCSGRRPIGLAAGLEIDAKLSPFNGTLGGHCEYWVVYRDGKLQAAKPHVPGRECTLDWYAPINGFRCNGKPVEWNELQYWPSRVITDGDVAGTFEVDFGTALAQ